MSVYVLSVHASYGCRERGVCCTSGWPIGVEAPTVDMIDQAMRDGRMPKEDAFTFPHDAPKDTPALLRVHEHHCVFHHGGGSRRCEVQRVLGHGALPLACRQFPRVSLRDPRGTSVTLSHYCPTARELLESAEAPAAEVVTGAPGFPDGEYVGLDVSDGLPPLLRPDMLMDWTSWWLFEREAVALIARSRSTGHALGQLRQVVSSLAGWRPADGPLESHTRAAFARADRVETVRPEPASALVTVVLESIPSDWRPTQRATGTGTQPSARARLGYLAAHAFANWTAHLGNGLGSWLRSLEAGDALLDGGLSVADADLWLRHLVDPHEFARRLSALD
jgi:hypothetical protein